MNFSELLLHRVKALKLHGVIEHWDEIKEDGALWLEQYISWEEQHRSQRSLDSRLRKVRLGRFKPLINFDWEWPTHCERSVVEQWMELGFMTGANNLIVCGVVSHRVV